MKTTPYQLDESLRKLSSEQLFELLELERRCNQDLMEGLQRIRQLLNKPKPLVIYGGMAYA